MTAFFHKNSRLYAISRAFKTIGYQLLIIGFFLTCLGTQRATAQACGTCATANCIGIKQYANKTAVLTGTGKISKVYSPALTSAVGSFTVYVTITTDAWGQVGVMQEIQMNGTSTGLSAQVAAVAATRTAVLYAVSDATCTSAIYPPNISNDGCSTTFNPAWTNLAPNTSYKLALTTNIGGMAAGYTYTSFNIRFYNAVRPIASLAFNCGTATYLGSFIANGVAGQAGALTIPITGATAGTATFAVSGSGFTGSVTTTIAAGQNSVSIPITYDGTGTAGTKTLSVTSSQATGTCNPSVIVNPQIAAFAFNCSTASTTGVFIANGVTPQTGTITIPIANTTQGVATFAVSGNGFSGSLSTTLTAGQTSVTFPISYDGSGAVGNHFVNITSPQAAGTCALNIVVIGSAGTFAFNCVGASIISHFVANGTVAQGGFVTIPITGAVAGKTTILVSGAGFSGSLTTTLTTNQAQVSIPITYDGAGAAGSRPLSVTSTQGLGTCAPNATVFAAMPVGSITFNCATNAAIIGSFIANGTAQSGLLSLDFTTQTAGEISVIISGNGFSGSYVNSVVAGQTTLTMPVTYDGSGAVGNHAVTITSGQATGTCAMNARVDALCDFACSNYNTSSMFIADGTTQNGTLVIPLSNTTEGTATFTASGGGFTGSITAVLQDSQRFVAIPVVYDGSSPIGNHSVTITSSQANGTCLVDVLVKDPLAKGCDFLFTQPVSFSIHSQNMNTSYTTQYVLVDANGVIQYTTAAMPFLGVVQGEYLGYAVNYSGTPPNLNVGTNLNSIGGMCTNLSNGLPIKMCGSYIFSCGSSTYAGAFVANGVAGQAGILYIHLINALALPTTLSVASGGFVGTTTQTLTAGKNIVAVPVIYDGTGGGGVIQVAVSGLNATGTCTVGVDVFPPPPAAPMSFNCGSPTVNGTFYANSSLQSGSITIPLTGAVAGTTNFTITGTGFSGGLVNTVLTTGQTSITIPVIYDGRGPGGIYNVVINSPNASASCTTPVTVLDVPAVYAFNCATATSTGPFVANGTAGQTGTLTLPITGQVGGTTTISVTGVGFTGTFTGLITIGQTEIIVPIVFDGAGMVRTETLTATSPQATGTCTPSVPVVCPSITAPTTTTVQPTCTVATGTITVTVPSAGVTYSFDNGTTFQAAATSSALVAGTYSIITKNTVNGCTSVANSTTLTAKDVPSAPTTTVVQPTCATTTGTITVTNPTSGVTYSFDNGTTFQASATSSALASGTYQVKVKDNVSNCTSISTPSVIDPILSVPSAPTTTIVQPTCATTTGTITITNPTSGVTYSFDNGTTFQAGATSSALASGTYQVKVKDAVSNCISTATPSVIDPILVVPSAPTTTIVQPTCATTTGTITVTNPTSGVTYSFDNGTTFQAGATSSALASGTYQVKVKDAVSNCISTATPSVIDPILVVPSAPTTTIVQPTCATTTGTITVTNPTSGVTYSFDNGTTFQAAATSSALASGTYQVKVKDDGSNCVSISTPSVIDPILAVPSAPTTTVVQPTCATTTGTITVTNPTSGVTYSFDNGTTFQASATSSALASGTYQVKVKDNVSNCISTSTPSVIDPILSVPSAPTTTIVQPTCTTTIGTITVTNPTSGVTYSFDNGTTFQAAATSSALASGTYQVKVKGNVSNCISTSTPSVIDPILSVPSAPTTTIVQPTCATTTGTITVTNPTSGVTYSFDNGTTFQAGATSSALASGTYQVKVKDNVSACISISTPSVIDPILSVPSAPTTTIVQPTCATTTGAITVTNPTSGVTYSFDNGTTFQAAATSSALASGTYQVKVKDNVSNCISTSTPSVIDPILAVPSAPTTTIVQPTCATTTGTITVTNPTSGVTYSFDNGTTFQVSATSNALASGTYQVKVKDNVSNCVSISSPSVIDPILTVPSAPTTTIVQPTCATTTGTITVTNPTSGVTYSFDNGTTFQAAATSSALASSTYQVKVKDNVSNCVSISTPSVIDPILSVPIAPTTTIVQPTCATTTGTITVTNPTSGVTYSFDNGTTFQAASTSNALASGTYQVKVKDNVSNCISTSTPSVIDPILSVPSAPTMTVVQPTCATTTGTITVTNPTSGVTYSFDNGTTFQAGATSSALASGTYQVKVKDNVSNCVSTSTPSVIDPVLAVPSAPTTTVVQPTCATTTGTITATNPTSGVTYSFDNGTTFQAAATSSALASGTYQVKVKDNVSNCISISTPSVIDPILSVPIAPTTTIVQPTCATTTGTITVTNPTSGVTYSFDNGTTFQAASTSNALASGTYQVKVKDNVSNCVSTSTPSVIDPILTVPSAPTTTIVQPTCATTTGAITVTNPTSGVTYSFDNGTTFQAGATSSALASGTYQVKVKDDVSACISISTPSVIDPILSVPSAPTTTIVQPTCATTTGTITVTNPTSGVTYSFDNGTTFQAGATSSALASGTYQVKVKDNVSACISISTPSVIDPILSVPSAPTTTIVQPTCATTTGTITVTTPTSGVTYSFDNGTTFQAASTSNALASGTYQVKVKDDVSNCVSTATPSVIDPILSVPIAPTTTIVQPTCATTTGTITVTNPTSGVTYSFDNGTTFQAGATSSALASGTYQVKVKDNVSNCVSTSTPSVIDPILAVPIAPTTTIVQPTCATTTGTITVTNPTSGVTYSFDNGTTFQAASTSNALASGTYQVKVKDNVSNCVSTSTPSVIDPILSVPSAPTTTVVQPTCATTTGTITVSNPTSGVTYSFDNGTTFQAGATSSALASGTYQVKVKDDVTGCVSMATPSVINAALVVPSIGSVAKTDPSVSSCPLLNNGTITVTATGSNLQYSKDNGATWQASNSFTGVVAGSYVLKVRDTVTTCESVFATNPVVLTAPTCVTSCVVPIPSIINH